MHNDWIVLIYYYDELVPSIQNYMISVSGFNGFPNLQLDSFGEGCLALIFPKEYIIDIITIQTGESFEIKKIQTVFGSKDSSSDRV